jgi:serine/threonine protein kinase
MEYADGPALDEVPSAAQPIAPDRMFSVLGQTAVAVHYAYQKGIVHQDIKPANTVICATSNPVPN